MKRRSNWQNRTVIPAVLLAASLAVSPVSVRAQVAVPVDAAALQEVLASCETEDACLAAIEQFIVRLSALNPGVPVTTVVASVASALVSAYNAGAVPARVAQVALVAVSRAAAARGMTELAQTLQRAVTVVAAGDPIDLDAVAEGSASPA